MASMENTDENPALSLALELVEQTGLHLFLTGKAGTGKTTFLKEVCRRAAKRMIVLAPTGIAAINAGGSTLHSFFQLPFGLYLPGYHRQNKFRIGKEKIRLMRSLDLIVIDEVSMLRADILDQVSGILQRYRGNNRPFGGVQLLMIGDLQQLAPIVRDEEWEEMKAHYNSPYFFDSRALKEAGFACVELTRIYRQSDAAFIELLEKIRRRSLDKESWDLLASRYRPDFSLGDEEGYITLTTHNYQSDRINDAHIEALPGKDHVYEAEVNGNFPESSFPTWQTLRFRTGAQVMFVKNDSSSDHRYYNGKIGRVIRCENDKVWVESEGTEIEVMPESWENTRYAIDENTKEIKEETEGSFRQLPLRLAWAVTIHKSQGLTFDKVVIDAGRAFAHGQVYVALSRCRSLEGVVLRSPLTQEALIGDMRVDSFVSRVDLQVDAPRLEAAKTDYLFALYREQFDFSQMARCLNAVCELFSASLRNMYVRLYEDLQRARLDFEQNVYRVGERFAQEIQVLRTREEAYRNQRAVKAACYFSESLRTILQPLLPRLAVESDNRKVQETLLNRKNELRYLLNEKLHTLEVVCQNGWFSPLSYLRTRSELAAGNESGGISVSLKKKSDSGRENPKGGSKTSVVPDSGIVSESIVSNPALFEKLKAWRTEKYREEGRPAYMILSQKALAGIADAAPKTIQELLEVKGIGKQKAARYGAEILKIVNGGD